MKRSGKLLLCLAWLVAGPVLAQIQIQNARWQMLEGNRGCDAGAQMAEACNGRHFCKVPVDPRYLCAGDPAPGRLKSLNISYSCAGRAQPIVSFRDGTDAVVRCEGGYQGNGGPVAGNVGNGGNAGNHAGGWNDAHDKLQVFEARWEVIGGGANCDATAQLIRACDGKAHCQIFVDPRYLCHGDPAPGQQKRLEIRYACNGERQTPRAFNDFSEASLHCGKRTPAPPPLVYQPQGDSQRNMHIHSARWEVAGGGDWCDARPQLSNACNGRNFCDVPVDPRYLCGGDPAPGRNKNLTISYSCDGRMQQPIAYPDFAKAVLRCTGSVGGGVVPATPNYRGKLQILKAHWQVLGGGAWCDAIPQLAQACNGKGHCRIRVDPETLCNGDPAPGQAKSLDIQYSCDGRRKEPVSFPDFSQAVLGCE